MAGEARSLRVEAFVAGVEPELPRLDVAFDVPPGISVLFGPSGSGKSTCLSVIAGLLCPERGRVVLGDDVLTDSSERLHVPTHRRRVALVFQSLALFPHMSVIDNVAYGANDGSSAVGWLERTRVAHLRDRRPATLSGGEAQRVALARALASEPRVLLLDEPFSALDYDLRRSLGADLVELVAELGIPTLLVTHDREQAALLGERVILLRRGRIAGAGAPAELLPA